jgi:hypothetical protein
VVRVLRTRTAQYRNPPPVGPQGKSSIFLNLSACPQPPASRQVELGQESFLDVQDLRGLRAALHGGETYATDRLGIVLDHRSRMIMLITLMGVE